MKPEPVLSDEAPRPIGPYSQAVRAGEVIFLSGQLGIDPLTGRLAEGIEAQAVQALRNIRAVLASAGCSMSDLVTTTVLLADMGDFAAVNRVYSEFFTEPFPARAAYQVAALPLGARVEIQATAFSGGGNG
ncbi:RidA family protein [Candidatus Fermentibacteria bacterium]|nr:RidA family protein [Candidatus Fermentibacteria bacterium]